MVMDSAPAWDSAAVATVCSQAEATLLQLQCKDARGRLLGGPNLHGVRWADICATDMDAGISVAASCIAAATSCAQAEASCK